MAIRIVANGPELQVNQAPGQDNFQGIPDIVTLTNGRYLVVFLDQVSLGNFDIAGQFVNADGTLAGPSLVFPNVPGAIEDDAGVQTDPAVAQRPDGGAVVVWADQTVGSGDIQAAVVNAAGVNTTAGGELNVVAGTTGAANVQFGADVATFSDGRSFIVWTRFFGGADFSVEARILDAAGTAFTTADRLVVADGAGTQFDPAVAASGLNALTVYLDTSAGNDDIVGRLFNGATDTFGAQFTIANHTNNIADANVAALPDNRFVIAYADSGGVFGKIYDPETPDGAFLSEEFRIDTAIVPVGIGSPRVTATVDGGFIVTWSKNTGGADGVDIFQRRYDAHGLAYGDGFIVNTLRDNNQNSPVVATSGTNVFTAWQDAGTAGRADTAASGIRGQAAIVTAFDYDSARFGDFDGGRADILFQNDTGDLTVWRTNSAGVLSSITDIGSLPAGFRVDGTGNFNSTAGDDILLRSPTQVAVLPMNGLAAQPLAVLGGTSPDFLNSGNGDFTGDGQSDLLFRNANTNQIVTWGVANNALSVAPQVLGSTAPQFRIVAVDDFTGDQQADILFRNETNGEIAIWRVANNALAGVPAVVGSTSTSFHVVATGDFDGNASNDILFRSDSGELAMWLLNSAGELLGAPQSIGTVSLDFHVEGTGDLNGDGRSDIIFRNAGGQIVSWFMNGTSLAQPPAALGTIAVDHAVATHHFDVV